MASRSVPLVEEIYDILLRSGPCSADELVAALAADGFDGDEDDVWEALDHDDSERVIHLLDDRVALLDSLARDMVLTHVVGEAECAGDFLALEPDLTPLSWLVDADNVLELDDGTQAVLSWSAHGTGPAANRGIPAEQIPDGGAFVLPQGTMRRCDVRPGDLISVRRTGTGFKLGAITGADVPESGTGLVLALQEIVDNRPEQTEPVELDQALWTALARGEGLLTRPNPPLGTLVEGSGLATWGEWLGPTGFDFPAWRLTRRIRSVQSLHELDEDEALAVLVMATMCSQVDDLLAAAQETDETSGGAQLADLLLGADQPQTGETRADTTGTGRQRGLTEATLDFLEVPQVAQALLGETLASDLSPAALGLFAESAETMAPKSARAGLLWLQGKAREALGQTVEAEQLYRQALDFDSGFHPAAGDLARYASDRSDATGGLEYLRRAGAPPNDDLRVMLEHFAALGRSDLGGKQPCWCGSGRKYKRCHLGREQLPLPERAAWLYQKAGRYLSEGPHRMDLIELAEIRAQHSADPYALLAALDDGLVADVAMFEGGVFEQFLADRGELLPEDERLLAQQWLLIERSLFEVEKTRPGVNIEVRDIRTGDRVLVRERTASRQLRPGDLICTRLLPAAETIQLFGGVEPVGMHQRQDLIDILDNAPQPAQLVDFLSRRLAPPVLLNTESEPITICEATVQITDPKAAREFLDGTYQNVEATPAGGDWIEEIVTAGMPRVRAQLHLAGHTIRVEANSETRFERVLAAITRAIPDARIASQTRTPADEITAKTNQRSTRPGGPGLAAETIPTSPDDPEIAEALAKMMRQYETNWLDEQIPALDGYTPRQAAADPTRRDDLIRLLNSFPAATNPGTMNPDNLRAALGL